MGLTGLQSKANPLFPGFSDDFRSFSKIFSLFFIFFSGIFQRCQTFFEFSEEKGGKSGEKLGFNKYSHKKINIIKIL